MYPLILAMLAVITGEAETADPLGGFPPRLQTPQAVEQGIIPPVSKMTPQQRFCLAKVSDPVADRFTYWACVSEASRGQQIVPDESGVPLELE